jgi:hypothetical protein
MAATTKEAIERTIGRVCTLVVAGANISNFHSIGGSNKKEEGQFIYKD